MNAQKQSVLKSLKYTEIDPTKKYVVVCKYPDHPFVDIEGGEHMLQEEHDSIIRAFVHLGCPEENIRIVEVFNADVDIQEE